MVQKISIYLIKLGGVEDGDDGWGGLLQTERYEWGAGVGWNLDFHFSLLYGMPAPSSESQLL